MEENFEDIKNKKNLFKTPENYFESFDENLFSKLPQNKKNKNIKIWSIAASLILLLGLVFLFKQSNDNQIEINTSIANVEIEEFMIDEEWDDEIYNQFSSEILSNQTVVSENELNEIEEEIIEIIEEELIDTEEIL